MLYQLTENVAKGDEGVELLILRSFHQDLGRQVSVEIQVLRLGWRSVTDKEIQCSRTPLLSNQVGCIHCYVPNVPR